jgi:hypothetical protein
MVCLRIDATDQLFPESILRVETALPTPTP